MIRVGICTSLVLIAIAWFVLHPRKTAGPPPDSKFIQLAGDEQSGSFRAQIDGRTFTQVFALESYLGTFPAHTYVSAVLPLSGFRPFGTDAQLERARKLHAELQAFCSERQMFYDGRSPRG